MFVLAGLLFPRRGALSVGVGAFAYACATEFSQLYHAPWIDAIRRVPMGRLVLGDTFASGDIAAYFVGIAAGVVAERVLYKRGMAPAADR